MVCVYLRLGRYESCITCKEQQAGGQRSPLSLSRGVVEGVVVDTSGRDGEGISGSRQHVPRSRRTDDWE